MIIHNAGSLNIDEVFRTPNIARPGETIQGKSLERHTGGKGLNQSIALKRAGANVRHTGRIGKDGKFLKELLKTEGVDVSAIHTGKIPTGRAIIQVADDGENAIVLYGGANLTLDKTDVERMLDGASPGDILLLQNETNMVPELMYAATNAGLRVAMNPAPMEPEVRNYPLHRLTWLVVNEIEGRELVDSSDNSGSNLSEETIVTLLRSQYPNTIIVMTLGKKGAIRCDESGIIYSSFPEQGPIIDTTGAGDTFMGYFLAGEVAGLGKEEGLQRACAAGALAVTKKGAAPGIPYPSEVNRVLSKL